ncbi:MAG: tRNA 2-thiouridine(34) synthase MnmA, partial [Lachnospiraceae bacterium]|nr:tRNA 2-thiouridine(34) synthase MnmA [Lachnospiraceae bacterium]
MGYQVKEYLPVRVAGPEGKKEAPEAKQEEKSGDKAALPGNGKKVVVGMSGGVDSSVAAMLLKKQGYDVIGVTMQIWEDENSSRIDENGGCCGASAVEDARRVAQVLDIPYYVMNFKDVFREQVICPFIEEYLHGRTPNPCILCNRKVKWEALLQRSLELGADYVATGHYARIEKLPGGRLAIRNSVTAGKDQTYALYNLTQEQLAHTLMPVGEYDKEQVRQMAKEAGLPVADKPDSQEICFVPGDDYASFIDGVAKNRVPGPGNFVTKDGEILGKHKGITHYTIGQRRGLELPMGHRVFVTEIRPESNEVVIGENEELFVDRVLCDHLNFMAIEDLKEPMRVKAKIRYNHGGEFCTIEKIGED